MTNDLEWMWKKTVVAQFKAFSKAFPEETEGNHGSQSQNSRSLGRMLARAVSPN